MNIKKTSIFCSLFFISSIVVGGLVGYFIGKENTKPNFGKQIRAMSEANPFINPLVLAEVGTKDDFKDLRPLQKKLDIFIDEATAKGDAKSVAIYYRNLNSGHWTGVNEEVPYHPASMLKVALMMAYYKKAESSPTILNEKVTFQQFTGTDQHYMPKRKLEVGKQYLISDLIEQLIVHSGNNSNVLLLNHIDPVYLDKVHIDLELNTPQQKEYLSAQSYSRIFRSLYNATYLTREYSSKALELLTKTEFISGIAAGVPGDMKVAHKFGERSTVENNETIHELHDCGIVYYPEKPYFICVMTKGTDYKKLESVISSLSQIVYIHVYNEHQSFLSN